MLMKLIDINEDAQRMMRTEDYEKALDEYKKAERIIAEMSKLITLAKMNWEEEDVYILTIFYNMASCYQKMSKLDECCEYIRLTIKLYKKIF